jgi:hypothetical protein
VREMMEQVGEGERGGVLGGEEEGNHLIDHF